MNMWGSINIEVLTSTVAGLVDVLSPSDALTCNVNFEPSLSIIEQATRTWPRVWLHVKHINTITSDDKVGYDCIGVKVFVRGLKGKSVIRR